MVRIKSKADGVCVLSNRPVGSLIFNLCWQLHQLSLLLCINSNFVLNDHVQQSDRLCLTIFSKYVGTLLSFLSVLYIMSDILNILICHITKKLSCYLRQYMAYYSFTESSLQRMLHLIICFTFKVIFPEYSFFLIEILYYSSVKLKCTNVNILRFYTVH